MLNKILQYFNLKLVKLEPKVSLKDINFDKEEPSAIILEKYKNENTSIKEEINKEIKKEIKKVSTLIIHFSQGHSLSWSNDNTFKDKKVFPWSDFYTWYFSRTTPLFVFKHSDGETIFKREDIVRVEYLKPKIIN